MATKQKSIAELQKEIQRLKELEKRKKLNAKISELKHGATKRKIKKGLGRISDNIIKNFG